MWVHWRSCGSNGGIKWVYWRAHVGLVAESYGSIGGVMLD
jgi:hypothetical protein